MNQLNVGTNLTLKQMETFGEVLRKCIMTFVFTPRVFGEQRLLTI